MSALVPVSRSLQFVSLSVVRYYQLSCFPDMSSQPIRAHYAAHRWSSDARMLKAWQRGMTGYAHQPPTSLPTFHADE